ncbi:hypothetical protein [Nocardioides panacisoli]|uniref:DUF2997 domain-containing protein n=1 Tax=Nocardioides panacisoli TaxID=627624 RepID=A0ABP7IGN6_9ACTN
MTVYPSPPVEFTIDVTYKGSVDGCLDVLQAIETLACIEAEFITASRNGKGALRIQVTSSSGIKLGLALSDLTKIHELAQSKGLTE